MEPDLYSLPATELEKCRDDAGVSRRAFQGYVREGLVYAPRKLGQQWFYRACTAKRLEAIAKRKGMSYPALRHHLWAVLGMPSPDWGRLRGDYLRDLELFAKTVDVVRATLVVTNDLRKVSRNMLAAVERKVDARRKVAVFDRRRAESKVDRASTAETALAAYLGKSLPGDFAAPFLRDPRWAEGLEEIPSPQFLDARIVIDVLKRMDEAEAERLRDWLRREAFPVLRRVMRPVVSTELDRPMHFAWVLAATKMVSSQPRVSGGRTA